MSSQAFKKRWSEIQTSQLVGFVPSVWIFKCLLAPFVHQHTASYGHSQMIQPRPPLQGGHSLITETEAWAERRPCSPGIWPELIVKECIIQEKGMGRLFQGERAAYTKAGTPTIPGDTGTASRWSAGWRSWRLEQGREQAGVRSRSQMAKNLGAISMSLGCIL